MICKTITNRYATEMTSLNLDIIKLIKNPIVVAKKDDSPLFNLSSNQVTKPTKRAGFDHGGSEWLVLDFDCNYTIEDYLNDYNMPNQMLYTSYSHKIDYHKFRVLIKLDRVYSDKEWKAMTKLLKRYFPMNDSCSFQSSRFHNCPCKIEDYRFIIKDGDKLNLMDMLGIDNGFLALLVSKVTDIPDEQPVAPCKSVLGYTAVGNLTVQEWLETKWNTDGSGNGGMFHRGLYGALSVAVKYSDWETVGKIRNACTRVGESKRFDKTLRSMK